MNTTHNNDDLVHGLVSNKSYSVLEVVNATGWSRTKVYYLMSRAMLPYSVRGAHRKIKGADIKSAYVKY